jgi:hypothetical protein
MMEVILTPTHLFWCLHLFNWRTCECKRTWKSSWRYISSRAPLSMLPSIGQIPEKISKKIGACLMSWKAMKKSFYHTHKWQFGNRPYKWEGSWWGIHNLVPSILNNLRQNYKLLIVEGTLSINKFTCAGIPINNSFEVIQCQKNCILVMHIEEDCLHLHWFKVDVFN